MSSPNPDTIKTSFGAATCQNDEYGFFVKHPVAWRKDAAVKPPVIYTARAPIRVPVLTISAFDPDKVQEQSEQIYKDNKMTNVTVIKKEDYVLADGVTHADHQVSESDYPNAKLISYSVGIIKGTKYINFDITTMKSMADVKTFEEVFKTITFFK